MVHLSVRLMRGASHSKPQGLAPILSMKAPFVPGCGVRMYVRSMPLPSSRYRAFLCHRRRRRNSLCSSQVTDWRIIHENQRSETDSVATRSVADLSWVQTTNPASRQADRQAGVRITGHEMTTTWAWPRGQTIHVVSIPFGKSMCSSLRSVRSNVFFLGRPNVSLTVRAARLFAHPPPPLPPPPPLIPLLLLYEHFHLVLWVHRFPSHVGEIRSCDQPAIVSCAGNN